MGAGHEELSHQRERIVHGRAQGRAAVARGVEDRVSTEALIPSEAAQILTDAFRCAGIPVPSDDQLQKMATALTARFAILRL